MEKEKAPNEAEELYVRIPLENINFADSFEQHKLSLMDEKQKIEVIENFFKMFPITVSNE